MRKAKATKTRPKDDDTRPAGIGAFRHGEQATAVEMLAGAAAGAALGSMVGPPGTIAGAVLGGLAGAAAGVASERDRVRRDQHDAELDEEIGVVGGNLGEANAGALPAKIGAFSAESMGVGGSSDEEPPAEGPIQAVDE